MEKKLYTIPQMESVILTTSYMIMDGISGGPGSGSATDPSNPPEQAPRRRVF